MPRSPARSRTRSTSRTSWSATTSASMRRSTLRTRSRRRSPPSRMLYVATRILRGVVFLVRDIDRTYNATVQPQRDAHLTELVFLDRGPIALRCIAVAVAAAACGVAGTLLVRLHQTLAAQLAAHMALNPLQTLHRDRVKRAHALARAGLPPLCFAAAVLRLRHGATEPPPGRTAVEHQTLGQLRAGLRREYRIVRGALVVVCLLAAVDVARTVASVIAAQSGDTQIATTMPATVVEALGYVVAALVLAVVGSRLRHRGAPARRAVIRPIARRAAQVRSCARRRSRRRARGSRARPTAETPSTPWPLPARIPERCARPPRSHSSREPGSPRCRSRPR